MTLRIRLENFEGVLLASVWFNIHVAMTSGRLSFASVEIDKIIPQLDPDENVCVVGDQLQLGSFLPMTWELEEREHGNEVVSVL